MNAPALTWTEKLPKASVQLAATLVLATLVGSNPPMTCPKVESVGVSSTIVIRVAFPKAGDRAESVKNRLRIRDQSRAVRRCAAIAAGIELNRRGEHHRPHVDGERTLTEGCSQQEVRIGRRCRIGRIVRARQIRHAGIRVDVAQRQAQAGNVDVRQISPCRDRAEGRIRKGRPRLAIVDRHVHAGIGADEEYGMIPRAEIGGIVGNGVFPVSHDRGKRGRQIICDRVRVGRRVVVLTEDRVRQVEDVAGDVDPGRSGISRRGDRIGDDVHALLGHGVGFVAAAGRVRDDRLDLRAVKPGGNIDPVVARAAATAVLSHIDLAGRRADVDEVAQVADALWCVRVRGTIGHGDAVIAWAAEDARLTDVEPRHPAIRGREEIAGFRADDDLVAVDRVDREIGDAGKNPLRIGSGQTVGRLQQAEGSADAVDLEEVGEIAAGAGEPVLVKRAQTLLVDSHAAAVKDLARRSGKTHSKRDCRCSGCWGLKLAHHCPGPRHRTGRRRSEQPHCWAEPLRSRTA